MLPEISLNANTQDISKQLSSVRAQLSNLKEAVESDLNNIGYENLSAALKAKIDNMGSLVESASEMAQVVAQTLHAKYATIDVLDAAMARVGTLEADVVQVNGGLRAVVADIQSINANMITTQYLQSNYATISALNSITISASQITSGKISANRIDVNNLMANTSRNNKASIGFATVHYLQDITGNVGKLSWVFLSSINRYVLSAYPGSFEADA